MGVTLETLIHPQLEKLITEVQNSAVISKRLSVVNICSFLSFFCG